VAPQPEGAAPAGPRIKFPPPVWEWEKRQDWEWEQDKENFIKMSNQAADLVRTSFYIYIIILPAPPLISRDISLIPYFYFKMVDFTESTLESILGTADIVRAVRPLPFLRSTCHLILARNWPNTVRPATASSNACVNKKKKGAGTHPASSEPRVKLYHIYPVIYLYYFINILSSLPFISIIIRTPHPNFHPC
jgi:hypothetical protein